MRHPRKYPSLIQNQIFYKPFLPQEVRYGQLNPYAQAKLSLGLMSD